MAEHKESSVSTLTRYKRVSHRPRVFDFACGSGGASIGYYLTGFDVIGFDTRRSPGYPFAHCLRDPLEALQDNDIVSEADLLHVRVAPPQVYDVLQTLAQLVVPWVLEVPDGTALPMTAVTLCRTHFSLGVGRGRLRRHRLFAASTGLPSPGPCGCSPRALGRTSMGSTPPDYTRWIGEQLLGSTFGYVAARDRQRTRIEQLASL